MSDKFCKDCAHYEIWTGLHPFPPWRCNGVRDVVTGRSTDARFQRTLGACRSGEHWEPLPPQSPKKTLWQRIKGST